MPVDLKKLLEEVKNLSREVGMFLKTEQAKISAQNIELKGHNDLVSYCDKEAEKKFVTGLQKLLPEAGFIAEEGTSSFRGETYNWIIDPLDGTSNFLYGIPAYCTSVALLGDGELLLGVIFDPVHDELFWAAKGHGAWLNGKKIAVSPTTDLGEAFCATGFPYHPGQDQDLYLAILKEVLNKTRGVRRLGSAALDICYVACGRFDLFYEYGLHPWDCAAGALILTEAGGVVSDFAGGEDYLFGNTFLGCNKNLQEPMLGLVSGWQKEN